MKKNILRAALTTTMLLSMVLGQNVITNAAAVTPVTAATPSATAKPAATPAPIMRDNLSKYGLKKDLELPVTVTAGGLSYTLEKIMIYDFKSKDAQNLVKNMIMNLLEGLLVTQSILFGLKLQLRITAKTL